MNEKRRDTPALKRLASERVRRHAEDAVRKVADSLFCSGNVGDPRDAFARAHAFVVGEEKRAVADDWAADCTAELVAQVFRFGLAGRRKEVARVQRGVAVKL